MTTITIARKSTRRIAFAWQAVIGGRTIPLNLTGCTLELLIDDEKDNVTLGRVAAIDGVIDDAQGGDMHFPITDTLTATVRSLFYEVWITDANGENYPIQDGTLTIIESLK